MRLFLDIFSFPRRSLQCSDMLSIPAREGQNPSHKSTDVRIAALD